MLMTGERLVFNVHHHVTALAKPLAAFFAAVAASVLLLIMVPGSRDGYALVAVAAVVAVCALYAGVRLLQWRRMSVVLTNRRLIYRSGILSRRSREIPLGKITDVTAFQGIFERIIGSGRLEIDTGSESGPWLLYSVPSPQDLKGMIIEATHLSSSGAEGGPQPDDGQQAGHSIRTGRPTIEMMAIPPERPPIYSEIVDQIDRLSRMRDEGVLSEEEFQSAKSSLIERLQTAGEES